jgi:ADP-L-glycero-D-manno-heptose 6-epimerase
MIVITGSAGFIGSALAARLNEARFFDLVLVDDFQRPEKDANHAGLMFSEKVERSEFNAWLDTNESQVQFVFHLGARTDTTEQDRGIFDALNLRYMCSLRIAPRLRLVRSHLWWWGIWIPRFARSR